MTRLIRIPFALLSAAALAAGCAHAPSPSNSKAIPMHETTEWQIEPSLKYDALCFANVLTGDPFYLDYYQTEYDRFKPKITPEARLALTDLKRKVKDEHKGIVSAFLCLYFSATEDTSLGEMLATVEHSGKMQRALQKTPYYDPEEWRVYESVRGDLKTILTFLQAAGFEDYWKEAIRPKVELKITQIENDLPRYNVIAQDELLLGFTLPSNRITVYMLYYSQPHGIRVTGTRFLTDAAWPFTILVRNAAHEMMHPPYHPAQDRELAETLELLKSDPFLMDKVKNHNPSFGYNSFEGYLEEDCVQALDQISGERLGIAKEPHQRWKDSDDGMHVFAVALYSVMKQEGYNQKGELFRDFLVRMIRNGKLGPGRIKAAYEEFYRQK
jgi:hypothetical protein